MCRAFVSLLIGRVHGDGDVLRSGLRWLARRGDLNSVLRYQPHGGVLSERRTIAAYLSNRVGKIDAENLFITSGAQHGLSIVALGLLKRGDIVATDQLTYPGFRAVVGLRDLSLHSVAEREGRIVIQECPEDFPKVYFFLAEIAFNRKDYVTADQYLRKCMDLGISEPYFSDVINLYSKAYRYSSNEEYKRIALETIAFCERELSISKKPYFSSLDADSQGEEGRYYVWTEEEINGLLTEDKMLNLFKS